MKRILFTLAALYFLLAGGAMQAQTTQQLWKDVQQAKDDGLPKTAVAKLDQILALTLAEKKYGEWLKAMGEKITLDAVIQGNKPEEKVARLKKELAAAPGPVKPLMRTILAEWYWQYYSRNRWRFMQRTATDNMAEDDFTTWDLKKIFTEIDTLHQSVLKESETLKKIPVSAYSDFLQPGTMPAVVRPTLFDFIAFEALDFYSSPEWARAQPEDAFEIDAASPALGCREDFLAWQPQTEDSNSPVLKAIRIYQQLLLFHTQDQHRAALADADLHRLRFVKNVAFGEDKNQRYIKRLEGLLTGIGDLELSSLARSYLAQAWEEENEPVKAFAIAKEGWERFPKSLGGQLCRALMASIEGKSLVLLGEKCVPVAASSLQVRYKNFTRLYFRIVPDAWDTFMKKEYGYPNAVNDEEIVRLLGKKPLREWQVDLPATPDYKEQTIEVPVPETPPGYYRVFASWKPDFTSSLQVQHTWLWVSHYTLLARSGQGVVDGFVLDAVSGEPAPGAAVTQIYRKGSIYLTGARATTDAGGYFQLEQGETWWDIHLLARKDDEELFYSDNIYSGHRPEKAIPPSITLFFTDRSLYRPGQTVYFKGICIRVDDEENNYTVLPETSVTVTFRDPNGQEVAKQTLVSNDFGSISGSFTAPADRLTGVMTLGTDGPQGSTTIRVEEYKRPKFLVELKKPETASRLNDEVAVTGKAEAYTGAPVDNAGIRFRVVREVRYPYWWGWFFGPRASESQEIAHGKLSTGADGTFTIRFQAKPDPKVAPKDEPTFVYTVYADVTDTAGETRSDSTSVVLGYAALSIQLSNSIPPEDDRDFQLTVTTRTLDGNDLPARGTLTIYRLKEPAAPVRRSLWRDEGIPDESAGKSEFGENWRLWPVDRAVSSQAFDTGAGNPQSLSIRLPAGLYKLEAVAPDAWGKEVKALLPLQVMPDWQARQFPLKLPNSVTSRATTVKVGETFEALWGTGYAAGRCMVEVEHRGRTLQRFWTGRDQTQYALRVPIEEKFRGGLTVRFTQVRDNRDYVTTIPVYVPWDNKELSLAFETFRDKLLPGAKETFTIRIKSPQGAVAAAEMAATLYDFSLDQFYSHAWSGFNFFYHDHSSVRSYFLNGSQSFNVWHGDWNAYVGAPEITYLHFPAEITTNWFYYGFPGRAMKTMAMGAPPPAPSAGAPMEMAAEAAAPSDMQKEKDGIPDQVEAKLTTQAETPAAPPAGGQPEVQIRKNLNETAFFYPHLLLGADGTVAVEFTMPEALTKWKFMGLAHTPDCQYGLLTQFVVTRKELMVQPNPPRFLREGDTIFFTAKVVNMSDQPQAGTVRLDFKDLLTDRPVNDALGLTAPEQPFTIPAGASAAFSWQIQVPKGMGPLAHTVVARAGQYSDGEAGSLPVLPSRIFLTESVPLNVRGPASKAFRFPRLGEIGRSDTLDPFRLTVQMASNPVWYAIQALPYLMEYPYECSEQVFNRLYANSLARHVAVSNPRIREVFDQWRGTDALKSNLEKNEELKSVLLAETPWVRDAQGESQAKRNVGLLFEENTIGENLKSAGKKLADMQLSNGSWPWFPGGRPDPYITLFIVTGYGRLKHSGVEVDTSLTPRAIDYLDGWFRELYDEIKVKSDNHLSPLIAFYLYGRSFYLAEKPIPAKTRTAVDYFLGQAKLYWLKVNNRMSQGYLALALNRLGDPATAGKIMASIRERSVSDEEMGMFWREDELSWWWYRAPIETQAVMIEAFDEVAGDPAAVEDCQVWLLKQKQTRDWKTTIATADAVYALILKGTNTLADTTLTEVKLGGVPVVPAKTEIGTGFYEQQYYGGAIEPGFADITVTKATKGISWGGVHFQYFEDMSKVTPHQTNLSLDKKLFVKRDTKAGPVIEPVSGPLAAGDLLTVRVTLRVDRDMEYVHLKDLRGSGVEPVDVLSGYHFQDGLLYYQSTKDTASHFFIDYLPKGTYVFQYDLRVQLRGRYQTGVAEIQCMYAPEFNSHSESLWLEVK